MARKPTKIIGISFQLPEAKAIEAQAESMDITTANYCRQVIRAHIKSGKKLQFKEK